MFSNYGLRLMALAILVLAVFQVSSVLASPVEPTGSDLAYRDVDGTLVERTFNPGSLRQLKCDTDLNGWGYARGDAIRDGIGYLRMVTVWGRECVAAPRSCVRVSCSYNSAIWLCNDRDDQIAIDCIDVGDYAQWILDHCPDPQVPFMPWLHSDIRLGQLFDAGNWNVIVRDGQC